MSTIANTLLDFAEKDLSLKDYDELINKCESELDNLLIDIQTAGQLIATANQSNEISEYDNTMAGFMVKNLGEQARELTIIKSDLESYRKYKEAGKIPPLRKVMETSK